MSKLYTSRTQEQEATRRRPAHKSLETSFANDTEAESVVLRPLVLPTLRIGRVDSPEERTADEVAHRVVGRGSVGPQGVGVPRSAEGGLSVSPAIADRIQARSGQGEKLPEAERAFFEPRFGRGFGDVTIHRDGEAASLARSLNAKAFTVGSDIYFGSGQYSQSEDGRRLMAHELTHTMQQGAGVQREVESKGSLPLEGQSSEQEQVLKLENIGHEKLKQIQKVMSDFKNDFMQTLEKTKNNKLSSLQQLLSTLNTSDIYQKLDQGFKKLGIPTPDGLIISLSGAIFSEYIIGGGGGVELVHTKGYGWTLFGQAGAGLGVPGGGGALEVGLIWGLKGNPENYKGPFIEFASGNEPAAISIFGFGTNKDDLVGGGKAGIYVGSPGASVQFEYYVRIYDVKTGNWFPNAVGFSEKYLK